MERLSPVVVDPWRAVRGSPPPPTVLLVAQTAPAVSGSLTQGSTSVWGDNSIASTGSVQTIEPFRYGKVPALQPQGNQEVRPNGGDEVRQVQALPDFTPRLTDAVDGPSTSTAAAEAGIQESQLEILDGASAASLSVSRADLDENGGPASLQQFRQLSDEQLAKMQRSFRDQVHQLHQVIDARLQGVATRRMLDDHATLGMLNQLSAACEARFKMLESDWALHGQRLARIEENSGPQEQLLQELEHQVRRMRLSNQADLGKLPREEDLSGTLEALQRDIDLLRTSQAAANGELMHHRAELLLLQDQNPDVATLGGSATQPQQEVCSSCGNIHLARAQFCRICGKKRDDKMSGLNTPPVGNCRASLGSVEDLDARLRGLEANMSAALNQRRNESAELALQIEATKDNVRLLEAHLQSLSADESDRTPGLGARVHTSILDCSSEAQDQKRNVIREDALQTFATKNDLLAVASSCKALEASVDSQIVEVRGRVESVHDTAKAGLGLLQVQISELRGMHARSVDSNIAAHGA